MVQDVARRPARALPTVIGGGRTPRTATPAVVPPAGRRIRVALLDAHEPLLERTAGWLAVHAPDLEVVLTATAWTELVRSPAFPTDLVVLDVQPGAPVPLAARVRTCRASGASVVVLTDADDPDLRERALAAGADAVVDRGQPLRDLAGAARAAAGRASAPEAPRDWRPLPPSAEVLVRPRLSLGEAEALRLYVSGHSTNEVAAAMNVQYETAKTYLRRVRDKYARANRPAGKKAELTRRALEDGYLS